MTRGILIAGNDSTLSRAIEVEAANRVKQYVSALIPNRLSDGMTISADVRGSNDSSSEDDKQFSLNWNPSSPISARALVLAAENRLERIDEAILVCSPPSIRSKPAKLPFSAVEVMLNDHIKGWFYLIKELTAIFKERENGTLVLVYPDINFNSGKEKVVDFLGPSAIASFRALAHGLLSAAHCEPYITTGFSTSDLGNETAFASFIFKSIDDLTKRSNGKLFKYGKFSFFK
ncbi:MAG: hypothetical protein LBC80_05860 [Treponema sp.]|jgi:hypothetical protein|nr:hypothetical protein [Treponema sp.]